VLAHSFAVSCTDSCPRPIQATILFELAAFVASHATSADEKEVSGLEVSAAYMTAAAEAAAELEQTLTEQATSSVDDQGEDEQRERKAKITMCHYLVIVACGCSAEPGTVRNRSLSRHADQLCKHMLLVRLDCSSSFAV
jgi:hypothetical protein